MYILQKDYIKLQKEGAAGEPAAPQQNTNGTIWILL